MYYCMSRYYDPEIGRWLSIDDVGYLDSQSVHGLNLYAYCRNNPVMYIDGDGTSPEWWHWVASGAMVVHLQLVGLEVLLLGLYLVWEQAWHHLYTTQLQFLPVEGHSMLWEVLQLQDHSGF